MCALRCHRPLFVCSFVYSIAAGASSFIRQSRQAGLSARSQVPSFAFLALGNKGGNTSKRGLASSSSSSSGGGSKTAVVMGLEVG